MRELLAAVMPQLVEALERHGELEFTAAVRDIQLGIYRPGLEPSPAAAGRAAEEDSQRDWRSEERDTGPDVEGVEGSVRRQVGYDRLASKEAYALLGQLYPLLCLQLNYFRPIRKILAKERVGLAPRQALRRTGYCLPAAHRTG